jgi:hypothetical protein
MKNLGFECARSGRALIARTRRRAFSLASRKGTLARRDWQPDGKIRSRDEQ